jgi:small subunit ribosomal protein S6
MIAHEYETTFILRPELDEAESNRLLERLKALITDAAGTILIYEDWGKRKLAYPIQKHQFGHYVHINFVAPASVPGEIERVVGIEDNIVRFLTVRNAANVEAEARRVVAEERQKARLARQLQQEQEEAEERRARREEGDDGLDGDYEDHD